MYVIRMLFLYKGAFLYVPDVPVHTVRMVHTKRPICSSQFASADGTCTYASGILTPCRHPDTLPAYAVIYRHMTVYAGIWKYITVHTYNTTIKCSYFGIIF